MTDAGPVLAVVLAVRSLLGAADRFRAVLPEKELMYMMAIFRGRWSGRPANGWTRPTARPLLPWIEPMESRLLLSVNVLTYHNDAARTGQNINETLLTPGNVNSSGFGKLFSLAVDGQIYAQPLYVSKLNMGAMGVHNVVFVATQHDSVYAFDADHAAAPLWQTSLLTGPAGSTVTPVPWQDVGVNDIAPEIGITGTPVIDLAHKTLYVVAKTKVVTDTTTTYLQQLHALSLFTGAERPQWPITINAAVPGTGDGSVGGVIRFNALTQNQRPGLVLSKGVVYVAWASHGDQFPYHGWVIGYNTATRRKVAVFNDTPTGGDGGIWMSGAAPAVDNAGNLFFTTGNGAFDANSGGPNYGSSVLKLSTANGLKVGDYFTPFNQAALSAIDGDVGSGGVLLLPDQPGPYRHEAVFVSKTNTLYLVNRDNLGHFNASSDSQIVQSIPNLPAGGFSMPAYFNGRLYFAGAGFGSGPVTAFKLSNGRVSLAPVSQGNEFFSFPGATPSVSANRKKNGIVWALQYGGTDSPGILRAYNAANLSRELYDSEQAPGGRDSLGIGVKFTVPTIANGKVYAGAHDSLVVYGLLGSGG